jgi:hypothetical protein
LQISLLGAIREQSVIQTTTILAATNAAVTDELQAYGSWTWLERFHPVPQSFRFPKCNVRLLWDLWWTDNVGERYAPYRRLRAFDLYVVVEKGFLSKAKLVISKLLKYTTYNLTDTNTNIGALTLAA